MKAAISTLALLLLVLILPAWAEDEKPALATDEEATAALETFEKDFKATGSKGEEKTAVREKAMRILARVQHPKVADRLAKLTRHSDADIRTLACMYLGDQKELPGYAGKFVLEALKKNLSDYVYLMVASDAVEALDFRGQVPVLKELLAHKDEAVRKNALQVIGGMKEVRMIPDVLQLMIDLKIDKGVKWEGGEVTYDSGAPGTHDQEMAEKIYHEKYGGNAAKGKSGGRKMRDMKPLLLETMKALTGEEFVHTKQAEEWLKEHAAEIDAAKKALDDLQATQEAAARALSD
jgi:HEAT repeat protein